MTRSKLNSQYKTLFLFFCLVPFFGVSQTWLQLTDFTGLERDDGVGVTVNNKAYFGTGNRAGGGGLGTDFYSFDLGSNTWTAIASMPNGSERQYASAFTYSNYFFVCGGLSNNDIILGDTYRYDVISNTWTTVASKPGMTVFAASCFTINNKAYIVGGRYGTDFQVSNQVWEYDMSTNVWTQKNNFPYSATWRSSAASMNGFGYLLSGKDASLHYHREIYKYDPSTDSWTKISDFPQTKRYYASMQATSNKLVVFGGIDSLNNFFNETWFFDEVSGFVQGPNLPASARKGGMSCFANGKFYFTCGISSGGRLKETWMLDVPVGIREIEKENNYSVFPNPSSDKLTIKGLEYLPYCIVELEDVTGKKVVVKEFTDMRFQDLDISSLEKGIYFLKIKSAEQTEVKKIIKE